MWLRYTVFAIDNAASTLGGDLTPFFIDQSQHPHLPLSPAGEPPAACATRMNTSEQEVRCCTRRSRSAGGAGPGPDGHDLSGGRPGDAADQGVVGCRRVGKLRPRWEGPFPVDAVAGPNTYTLTLPERFKCSPTIKVDRLKPYFLRTGLPPSPGPVTHRAGGGIRGGTAPQQQDGPRTDLLSSAVASPRGRLVETGLAPR